MQKSIILFILFTSLYGDSIYYDVNEYNKKYKQQDISKEFTNIVKNAPIKLTNQKSKKIKIALVNPTLQLSEYWYRNEIAFKKRLEELGIKYELKRYVTKPVTQINKQAKQLLNAIKEDVDYLIFTLDVNKHTKFIDRIISEKKPKLILQNITTPLKRWKEKQPFLYVGFDHFIGSKLIANELIKQTNGKGKYAVIHGAAGYVSYMRGTKFIEYVSKNSDLELVHEYYTKVIKDNAKKATIDLLKIDDEIEFIYACRTNVTFGVLDGLEQTGYLNKIKLNGWGGGANEIELIHNNKIDLTVMRMNDENAIAMAEAIKLDLEGKSNKVPTIYSGGFELITKQTSKEDIEKFKKEAFRYSNE